MWSMTAAARSGSSFSHLPEVVLDGLSDTVAHFGVGRQPRVEPSNSGWSSFTDTTAVRPLQI